MSRAVRRHHRERIILRRLRQYRDYSRTKWHETWLANSPKHRGMLADCSVYGWCSCMACSGDRRYEHKRERLRARAELIRQIGAPDSNARLNNRPPN